MSENSKIRHGADIAEPKPSSGEKLIYPLAIMNLVYYAEPECKDVRVTAAVIHDVVLRTQVGFRTYGTFLKSHNGREAIWDAYQEAIDLVMYLSQEQEETLPGQGIEGLLLEASKLCADIRRYIDGQTHKSI